MNLDDFYYPLPEKLIAQEPLRRRDQARLMVVDRRGKRIRHDIFANMGRYLPARSCIVLNDSKVIPARLLGRRERSGGQVEIFLLNKLADGYSYETLMRPLRRLKTHERIVFNGGRLVAQIEDIGRRIIRFNKRNLSDDLDTIGHMPLPPYIKRMDGAADRRYYQTVYARREGSVAAPTAGLHFTSRLIKRIQKAGHKIAKVTLHINYATFKPVSEKDITKHHMHHEEYSVAKKSYAFVRSARNDRRKIVAVGTTSCRVLESIAGGRPLKGNTDIYIYPGYHFQMTDILVTNFHLPHSTLLMLVYAFGGMDLMARAYQEAVREKYRFYSYGDAMMIV